MKCTRNSDTRKKNLDERNKEFYLIYFGYMLEVYVPAGINHEMPKVKSFKSRFTGVELALLAKK